MGIKTKKPIGNCVLCNKETDNTMIVFGERKFYCGCVSEDKKDG